MPLPSLLRGLFPSLLNPMAPGNMKSDFVGLQRNKIAGRGALSSRNKGPPARLGPINASASGPGARPEDDAVNMALATAATGTAGPPASGHRTTGAPASASAADTSGAPALSNNNSNDSNQGVAANSTTSSTSTNNNNTVAANNSTTTTSNLRSAHPCSADGPTKKKTRTTASDHDGVGGGGGGVVGGDGGRGDPSIDDEEEDEEDSLILVDDGEGGKLVERHEVEHLKALSMLHLDVIEQQQNELQRRDKELQRVRAQNDTLKARLERIQRRTILAQKHQEPLLNHVHISAGDSPLSCKRKSSLDVSTPVKRQQMDKEATPTKPSNPSTPGNATPTLGGAAAATPTRRGRQLKCKAKEQLPRGGRERATPAKEERAERGRRREERPGGGAAPPTPRRGASAAEERTPRKEGAGGSKVKEERRNGGEGERGGGASSGGGGSIKPEQYLKTQVIYPCLSDLRVTDPDPALPEGQTVVQVPSWRLNVLTSSPSAEMVEDMEDMTYERRHQKYEVAEQKRKRWDIQRVRELREHERLEQKMLRREYGNWDDVLKTFYPEPSDACQLQVSDTIPLVAFGVQVPIAKDVSEFELPWFDLNQRDKDESRRQTRSRTNRR